MASISEQIVGPLSGVRLQVSSTHTYLYEPAHSCTSGSPYANEVPSHPDILEEVRFGDHGNLASFLDL